MNKVIDPTSELDKLMMEDDDLSYLELKNIPDQVYNPLLNYPIDQPPTDPIQDTLNTMLDYNYLHFACKFILNVELLPFQLVILDTLWRKRLPMLIATRGGGKCVKGNTLCQTNNGLLRIDEIISKNSNILDKVPLSLEAMGELSFNKVEYGWNNGITKTIKIITSFGYEIEGTLNHPIRVLGQDGNLEWKELQYITNDDIIPISRKEYNFGNQEIFSKDIAWWIGATIGDGMVCRNNKISFTNIDKDIIIPWCEISENLSGKKVTKLKNGLSYDLYSKEFCTKVNEQWGLNYQKAHDKSIPRLIRESKKEIVASFIAGLFDTDGGCTPKGVEYTTVSEDLSIQVQSCLLAFGIISNRKVRYTKCNNKKFKSYRISIIGSNNLILFKNHIRFRCKRKQLKLELLCKKISNPNKDILPNIFKNKLLLLRDKWINIRIPEGHGYSYNRLLMSKWRIKRYNISYNTLFKILDLTKILNNTDEWKELKYIYDNHYLYDTINLIEGSENQTFDIHIPNDHSFIANGIINHNSFMLSVYALLRMVFHPGCRIVIVGAAFRQSRQLHDYMTFIWEKAPLLRDIAGKGAGPKREIDRCEFWIGDSSTYAIPLGTGEKIRGLRANYIFSDEFSCVGEGTIVETDKGLMRIEDCENRQDINLFTGDDNILEKPSNFIKTPLTDVYKITTANGYSFSCSSIHKVYTTDGWKLGKDLTNRDYLLFENNYKFPEKYIEKDGLIVDENLGWLMGILLSEGSINSRHSMAIHMIDKDCIDRIEKSYKQLDININVCRYEREESEDKRGWINQKAYVVSVTNLELRNKLESLGLKRSIAHNKIIPWCILQSPKSVIISFLAGLFERDGSCFLWKDKLRENKLGIAYYSVCEQLVDEVQILLSKLDIVCNKQVRKSKLSDNPQWMLRLNGEYAYNFAKLVNIKKWEDNFNNSYTHFRNKLKGITWDKNRNKWKVSPIYNAKTYNLGRFSTKEEAIDVLLNFRHSKHSSLRVKKVEKLDDKEILYDFYLPQSHSFYGNGFRQHNSIPENIFSLVVQGFGIVSASPVDKVKQAATIRLLRQSGGWTEQMEADRLLNITGNQIVYSGTAYYSFNHFYRYFKKWHAIISSKGDMNKIKDLFGENEGSLDGFDWRDYAIIRLPYTQVPEGYLDAGILAQARATLHHSQFLQEYCAVFAADSSGFFRRSIIEATTTNAPILVPSGQSVQFSALRYGDKDRSYVIAVDPAADADNAAIVILELHKDHRRIVHCWTTNRKKYNQYKKAMKESKIDIQDDYYRYIAKKIRSLMRNFNTERIVMDKNGGGVAIQEALMSRDTYDDNEKPIYTIIDLENPKPEDIEEGIHILQLVVPTSEMNSEANHGMLKDLQDKILLFPMFDTIEMEKAIQLDKANSLIFDTYEDLVLEIEELKNEMTTIVVTPSSTLGREIFDTPLVKGEGARKGRLRKDRYSALLYANFYARNRNKTEVIKIDYKAVGGTKDTMKATVIQGTSMYRGPGLLKFNNSSWAKGSTKTTIFRKSR